MTNTEIKEILNNTRYFSPEEMPKDIYDRFSRLRTTLMTREEDDTCLLNKGNVIGVWYMTDLSYDEGNPQIILRVDQDSPELKLGAPKRLYLNDEIFNIILNDVCYDYDEQVDKNDSFVEGLQDLLFSEIANGRVLTIYNKERE